MKTEFVALTPAGTFALLFAGFLIGEVYARSRNVERAAVDEAGINILRNLCRRGAAPFFGAKMKSKKPKWPALFTWQNILMAIIFLAILWFVVHLPMLPG
jgi:hypothetical protein